MTALEVLTGVVALLLVLLLVLLVRQSAEIRAPRPPDPSLQLVQQQMDALRGQLQDSLGRVASEVDRQIGSLKESVAQRLAENVQSVQASGLQVSDGVGQALQAVGEVRQQLGQLREASERIREVGKDISGLKEILQAPQFRGGLGEFLLEEVLAQLFPKAFYSTQHTFQTGERVDAVLKLGKGVIPIDSKFPLESFRRFVGASASHAESEIRQARRQFRADVRKHIEDIANKYIRPQENFYDFALMYIPAENVYYESIIREDLASEETGLFEFALAKRVIPVSPNTLFAYLQVIALGLKGLQIEESAQKILSGLGQLEVDLGKVQASFEKVGTQLQYAQSNFADAEKSLSRFAQHLTLLSALPTEAEPARALPESVKRSD